jgi:hypothetical protein
VTTVRIAHRVRIVFVNIKIADQPLLAKLHLRAAQQALEDALPCLVIGHDIVWTGALRGGVFGV